MLSKKDCRQIFTGVGFLLPNICGFLAFTAIPLVTSFVMAFTNWNLKLHNVFRDDGIKFIGFDNFVRLFNEPDFLTYLGNTLFFMMGIPFGIAGSLCAALLLNSCFKCSSKRIFAIAFITICLIVSTALLVLSGAGASAILFLVIGLAGVIVISGSIGGASVYRTLFYFPHFTAGVATFILWKKLYSPENGPINNVLGPMLNNLAPKFAAIPSWAAVTAALIITLIIIAIFVYGSIKQITLWRDGESGLVSSIIGMVVLSLPMIMASVWSPFSFTGYLLPVIVVCGWIAILASFFNKREHSCPIDRGIANAVVICGAGMVFSMLLLGLSKVVYVLPETAANGLTPPKWIADYYWAKPSIMFMGLWSAIGSNNMLLYLAGLSGIPQELYEAADIDGARGFKRFWHVTWPQLSNVTFFILVMAVIGGLQGGFQMARTMTQGGPAGATTTLSYYIYTEGFDAGRLGYASAVSWALFLLVFSVTLFNWKFGNKYTND